MTALTFVRASVAMSAFLMAPHAFGEQRTTAQVDRFDAVWRACDGGDASGIFSLDYRSPNALQYRGGPSVKEARSITEEIGSRKSERLLAAVRRAVRGSGGAVSSTQKHGRICIDLNLYSADPSAPKTVTLQGRTAADFDRQVWELLALRKWIKCPTEAPEMYRCGVPTISFEVSQRESCSFLQSVFIYKNGVVHYRVREEDLRGRFVRGSRDVDLYWRIGTRNLNQLVRAIQGYEDVDLRFQLRSGRQSNQSGKDVQQTVLTSFADMLVEHAHVQWTPLPATAHCILDKQNYPAGQISLSQ